MLTARRRVAAGLLGGIVGVALLAVAAPTVAQADNPVVCVANECRVKAESKATPAKETSGRSGGATSPATSGGKSQGNSKDAAPAIEQVTWTVKSADGETTQCEAGYVDGSLAYSGSAGTGPCTTPPGPDEPADGAPVATVTPAQLAQMAVARLKLPRPEIGIVPDVGPDKIGLVGLPVWMWTDPAQWRPTSATAAVPGMSITATARITRIDWNMGDGTTVTCRKPGTPYQDRFGDRMSPDCGHRYEQQSGDQPGDAYQVTATATYQISWTGAATGSTTRTRSSTVPITIGELQVLITRS